MDIFMAAVLFISWTSVTHRAWQWPSVQVDVSCVGYGHLHFNCFYLGDLFFLNRGGGILRMLPRIIYSIYTFLRVFSVSQDSSKTHTSSRCTHTQTSMNIQFTDMHADTCTHTHELWQFQTKAWGIFSAMQGHFYRGGVDVNRQWDKHPPSSPDLLILCPTVLFLTPGRTLYTNTSEPSQGFG